MFEYNTALGIYLAVVLGLAALAAVAALGTVATIATRNRRVRLDRRQSLRAFYGPRLSVHH
jgi:hypothetical protein